MYCTNCGNTVDRRAVICPRCGVAPWRGKSFCPNCAHETNPDQAVCLSCGVALPNREGPGVTEGIDQRKLTAGLLAIFLGWLGIHKFYLGYKEEAIIMLIVSIVGYFATCGVATSVMAIIGVIEGVLYLTRDDMEFERIYIRHKKGWF